MKITQWQLRALLSKSVQRKALKSTGYTNAQKVSNAMAHLSRLLSQQLSTAITFTQKKSDKPSEFIAILLSCYGSIQRALSHTWMLIIQIHYATIGRTIAGAAMDYLTISISANRLSAWSKYFITHNI